MTPKEYATYILRDVSHKADITELAQAYLQLESRIQKLAAVAEAAMDALDHVKQYDSREFGTIGRLGQHVNTILERINKLLDDALIAELEKK